MCLRAVELRAPLLDGSQLGRFLMDIALGVVLPRVISAEERYSEKVGGADFALCSRGLAL